MKIKTNKVESVLAYFREELKGQYVKEEIENFIFYSFEHYLHFSRTDLLIKSNEGLSESELLKFINIVKQLKQNKPIQYILGETIFYDLKFIVNEQVLIPRPETEELVDWIIKENPKSQIPNPKSQIKKILDIGTGSGCIPISIKHNMPNSEVYAMDISEGALSVAKQNAAANKTNVNFIHQDALNILSTDELPCFDIIVSNPPYVRRLESQYMFKNVLDFEPHLALFVDDNDALKFYKAICNFAQTNLNKGGLLYFEINEHYGKEIVELLTQKGFSDIELKKDIRGKERMIRGVRKCEVGSEKLKNATKYESLRAYEVRTDRIFCSWLE